MATTLETLHLGEADAGLSFEAAFERGRAAFRAIRMLVGPGLNHVTYDFNGTPVGIQYGTTMQEARSTWNFNRRAART